MAKLFGSIKMDTTVNNSIVSQEFNVLRTRTQVGDAFYIPVEDNLLVLGTARTYTNNEGEEVETQVAQRIIAVKLDSDNTPLEAVELYVGQLVKLDAKGVVAFNNDLFKALRKGSDAFKSVICGKILNVTESKEIQDRVWDQKEGGYARNEDGSWVTRVNTALNFVPKASALTAKQVKAAEELLVDYVKENYSDFLA